jgi:type II secretion system protein D
MTLRPHQIILTGLLSLSVMIPIASARQDDRPDPVAPERSAAPAVEAPAASATANNNDTRLNRPPMADELVPLGFKDVLVEETFAFLAVGTGKVVMPVNLMGLRNRRVTLLTERPVPRSRALDLLFQAFRVNGVGVIEREDVLIVGLIDELAQIKQAEVIDADESIAHRLDRGNFVVKMYRIRNVPADAVAQHLTENLPSYATVTVDINSNQIMVFGDIALCQHFQVIIDKLDANYLRPETRTFRLAHADAQDIANQILELYENRGQGAGAARPQQPRAGAQPVRGAQAAQAPRVAGATVGPELELRVAVLTQLNSLTVIGEPAVVTEIGRLIKNEWDLPRAPGTSRIFTLRYTDPIKVAERLNSLLGQGGGTIAGRTAGAGGRPGGAGGTSVDQQLSGIYKIESYPDTNQILIFAKTEESLAFITGVIKELDQPTTIGLPFVVELKHASAVELAEQLNALLAEAGSGASIRAPEEGLSGASLSQAGQGAGVGAGTAGGGGSAAGTLDFPWQRGGRQRDDQTPESPLIGKVRIVPIVRQNALAILCPRPQEEAVRELIEYFDRPGRQVMISVILAELVLSDTLALGLRFSSSSSIAQSATPDNLFTSTLGISGSSTDTGTLGRLFDTSIINTEANLSLVLQALKQENNLRVLQQPVVFTADNREAFFFDGQEIPFITNTTINSLGQPTDSFDYRDVGIVLNARPRITRTRDIDMELRLELSAIVPGQTLFGGAIIDKRLTTTHVIVKNGQTIVLSGILKESESKIRRRIPFLGEIPIIGELFTSRENVLRTSELVAFITPIVVDNPDENDSNFQEAWRSRLDDLVRPVDEQFREFRADPEKYRRRMSQDRGLREHMRTLEEEAAQAPPPDASDDDDNFFRIIDP